MSRPSEQVTHKQLQYATLINNTGIQFFVYFCFSCCFHPIYLETNE